MGIVQPAPGPAGFRATAAGFLKQPASSGANDLNVTTITLGPFGTVYGRRLTGKLNS
jgi:hypothetical protein